MNSSQQIVPLRAREAKKSVMMLGLLGVMAVSAAHGAKSSDCRLIDDLLGKEEFISPVPSTCSAWHVPLAGGHHCNTGLAGPIVLGSPVHTGKSQVAVAMMSLIQRESYRERECPWKGHLLSSPTCVDVISVDT